MTLKLPRMTLKLWITRIPATDDAEALEVTDPPPHPGRADPGLSPGSQDKWRDLKSQPRAQAPDVASQVRMLIAALIGNVRGKPGVHRRGHYTRGHDEKGRPTKEPLKALNISACRRREDRARVCGLVPHHTDPSPDGPTPHLPIPGGPAPPTTRPDGRVECSAVFFATRYSRLGGCNAGPNERDAIPMPNPARKPGCRTRRPRRIFLRDM